MSVDRWGARREWAAFGLLLLCHIFFLQIYPNFVSTNELSRFLLVSAVVDYGTFRIDEPLKRFMDSQDKAVYQDHYYSDKAIGTALLGIPIYVCLKVAGHLLDYQWPLKTLLCLLRIFCVTLPAILFLRPLCRFWNEISPEGTGIAPCLFVFLFGTISFTYSQQFISYHLLGVFLFLSFYYIYRYFQTPRTLLLATAGFFSGAALITEYPAAVPVAVLLCWLLVRMSEKTNILYYIFGAAPLVLILLWYNYSIFGTPFDVTYRHMSDVAHAAKHRQGIAGVGLPQPQALFGLLLGKKQGLFFVSPVLLLSLPGLFFMIRNPKWGKEGWLFAAICIGLILVYSGASNWNFGWAFGPRYLTALTPFLMTGCLTFLINNTTIPRIRNSLFLFLAAISVCFIVAGTITFPFPAAELQNPLFSLHLPMLFRNGLGRSLGDYAGVSPAGNVILLLTVMALAYFILSAPDGPIRISGRLLLRKAAPAILGVAIVLAAYAAAPKPDSFGYFARASAYYYVGSYEEARLDLKRALEAGPDSGLQRLIDGRLKQMDRLQEMQPR